MNYTYSAYAEGVSSGSIPAPVFIKKAVDRFYSFLNRDDIEFRKNEVDIVIDFLSILKHCKGVHAGKSFIPEPWQQFIIAFVYGFWIKGEDKRLINSVYIEIPRKNGKTAFAGGLCLYSLTADGELGAEVYLAANSKDQAKVAFGLCSSFCKSLDKKRKHLIPYRDSVTFDEADSFLKVLAADDSKLDGFNASIYLLDEYHAARNSGLKDVLQSSQGARLNPLGIIITTAGFDLLGPCYEYRKMCIDVLSGLKQDDSTIAFIWCPDEGDDWKDPDVWRKVNPNIGVTVYESFITREVNRAVNAPSEEVAVKTKTLNIWCQSIDVWISDSYIINSSRKVNLEDFGRNDDCFVGIDLSATSDLTCVTYLIPKDDLFYFKTKYYLPEEALLTKRHKDQYGEWVRQGDLIKTPGNVVDYDYILNDLMKTDKMLYISKIGYDSWNSTQFVINAESKGLPMEPYSQTIGNFNRPTRELERIILSGRAVIDNNVITRHCFRNVVMARDRNGNIKPSKQYEDKKIDGVIGMLQALGVCLITPRYAKSFGS